MAVWRPQAATLPCLAGSEVSGLLIVDKPAGMTSHDVVTRVRQLARQRAVGHAGTLDPLATGVLVLCLGQATRLIEYLLNHDKSYRAVVRLGQVTDTYDAEGRVVAESAGPLPDRPAAEAALAGLRGDILQQPPAYSAIKVHGQPAYRRARRGEDVALAPRRVTIYRLELVAWAPPLATLEVDCSAGTYVRSLAHDWGRALGCGAHLAGLTRTRSGPFTLAEAAPLPALEAEALAFRRRLLPMDAALSDSDALQLDADESRRLVQGQPIAGPPPRRSGPARAYSDAGDFLAVIEFDAACNAWRPRKVFVRESHANHPTP